MSLFINLSDRIRAVIATTLIELHYLSVSACLWNEGEDNSNMPNAQLTLSVVAMLVKFVIVTLTHFIAT